MGKLIENVIQKLQNANAIPGPTLNEAIGNAGFLIEKASGLSGLRNTWPESVLAEPICPKQIEQLKAALISFVSEGGMPGLNAVHSGL